MLSNISCKFTQNSIKDVRPGYFGECKTLYGFELTFKP